MPREMRSQRGAVSQRSTRTTQMSQQRGDRESSSEHDDSNDDKVSSRATHSRQKPAKRARIETVHIPPAAKKWMEKGIDDLPAIPSIGDEDDDENEAQGAPLMVTMLLIMHSKKEPFTNNQLKNQIQKSGQKIDFDATFKLARKLLYQDFGVVLAEITVAKPFFPIGESSVVDEEGPEEGSGEEAEEGTQKTTKGRKTRTKSYILISALPRDLTFINCGKREFANQRSGNAGAAAKLTVLTLSLLYMFMEGGEASDEVLWNFLTPYGFSSDKNHKLLKDIPTLFNSTFVKQQYIIKHHTQGLVDGGVERCFYRWGPRADLEFSRMALLELCGKVFNVEADMEHFGERYTNAEATEKRRKAKIETFSRNL